MYNILDLLPSRQNQVCNSSRVRTMPTGCPVLTSWYTSYLRCEHLVWLPWVFPMENLDQIKTSCSFLILTIRHDIAVQYSIKYILKLSDQSCGVGMHNNLHRLWVFKFHSVRAKYDQKDICTFCRITPMDVIVISCRKYH